MKLFHLLIGFILLPLSFCLWSAEADLQRLQYNNSDLVVDLGVGLWAWPMPMDWDSDGDLDLVVACPDFPFNGIYWFENPGNDPKTPVFKPPVRVADGPRNMRVSFVDGEPRVLTPGEEWVDFLGRGFDRKKKIYEGSVHVPNERIRAKQWHYADYDNDGAQDLIVGIGVWEDYGWDNAYNEFGRWTNGPLHGFVYLLRNRGTTTNPDYDSPVKLVADDGPVDVYGMPSPNLADFDGDGDLDLLCGEFLDGFTYFQNLGSRANPVFATGKRLTHQGRALAMHVQMITPTAIDWDRDGDVDLIVGDEDGRVAWVENTGRRDPDGTPRFLPPFYFQQEAHDVKFGALVTPVSVDWDGDGDEDLVCGNTSGNIAFLENLDGGDPPRWAAPVLLETEGQPIRLQAGPNGSIQGPCEAKWGYTTLSVADWDHDGLLDLVVNSIWGRVIWFKNVGSFDQPVLAAARPVQVRWKSEPPKPAWNWWDPRPGELSTQWRTTPVVVDWNQDGLNDLMMLDHKGYLAFFPRIRDEQDQLALLPGQRLFFGGSYQRAGLGEADRSALLQLNHDAAGRSGRRKLCIVDWDGDGLLDLLVNSSNADFLRNTGAPYGMTFFDKPVPLAEQKLIGHTTSPTTVDWDKNGIPDLLIGAEDGRFYYKKNPRR